MKLYILLILYVFFHCGFVFGQKQIIINIDNPSFRKLIAAIPDFITTPSSPSYLKEYAQNGARELERLLKFSSLFNIMSYEAVKDLTKTLYDNQSVKNQSSILLKAPSKMHLENIDITQWKAIGVESLTIGKLQEDKNGLILTIKTIDINKGEFIVGKKYTKIKKSEYLYVIRRYADAILEAYTGKPGIFNTKIVFIGKKHPKDIKQVYICDFDGSNVTQITYDPYTHLSPSWSPDTKYITFTSYKDNNPDLYIYEVATGKVRKLSGVKGLNSGASWAPNNKIIVFTGSKNGNADLYLIEPSGANRRLFIEGSGLDVDPVFSPDGKHLAFVSGRYANPHIFRVDLSWKSNTNIRIIGEQRLTYAGWYNATPKFSPNSEKIIFAGYDKDIDRFDIFIMNKDGTNLERLTINAGDNENPSFSPNGQLIIFQSNRIENSKRKGPTNLYLMTKNGSNQKKFNVNLYEAFTPMWSNPIK